MLSLILRIAVVVGLLVLATLLLTWFQAIEGQATISFAGYEIAMRTSRLLLTLAAGFALIWLAVAILRRGVSWLFSFASWAEARRHARGLDALSKAMIALAEGEGLKASKEAERAERLLHNPDLTRLINAQAARMAGDKARSEQYFEEMAGDKDTDYLGIMGLLRTAIAEGKRDRALRLAEQAHALRPKKAEIIDILFDLQKERRDWDGARRTVQAAVKAGRLTRDVGDRRRAVLSVAEAMERETGGDRSGALEHAMVALRFAPGFAPAAVIAARLLNDRGERRSAQRRLADAWRVEPHPEVAEAYAALDPDEDPSARLKRFDRLFAANPTHAETKMLKAELALAAGDAALARRSLADAVDTKPVAKSFAVMAAIEEAQGADEPVVRGWLAKAAAAPRAARWTCGACATPAQRWTAECANCGAFDQLTWRSAARDDVETGVDILALVSSQKALEAPKKSEPEPERVTPTEVTPPPRQEALPKAGRAIEDAKVGE